jgi:hypothetical protein
MAPAGDFASKRREKTRQFLKKAAFKIETRLIF